MQTLYANVCQESLYRSELCSSQKRRQKSGKIQQFVRQLYFEPAHMALTNCDANISFEKLLRWPCKSHNKNYMPADNNLYWKSMTVIRPSTNSSASTAFLSRIHSIFEKQKLQEWKEKISPRQTSYLHNCLISIFIWF